MQRHPIASTQATWIPL